ncbi:MAG: hypothetical protein K6C14_01740 [Eubacterium sp.]|nr:hypothetical protein [Eubacterium sp.]
MKKRRRFYNNKDRNRKWTETETGRPIDFAEKYENGDAGENKFVEASYVRSSAGAKSLQRNRRRLKAIITVCSVLLVIIGFIGADIHIYRSAKPFELFNSQVKKSEYDPLSELQLSFTGISVPSISLDGSVMLSAVADEAHKNGKTAVMFDAKRSDGTIGYQSAVSAVSTFGVLSSQGSQPALSFKQLNDGDLLPVARIFVYLDNSVPTKANEMALKKGKKLYRDGDGNTYLDPNSEITYAYIRDIVNELSSFGITVFVLDGCTVKDKDYFGELSKRLNQDIGNSIRLLEAVNVKIKGYDAESGNINSAGIKNDISKFPELNDNQIYIIESELKAQKYASALNRHGVNAYVVIEG